MVKPYINCFSSGVVSKLLSVNNEKKQAAKQDMLDKLLKGVFPLLSVPTNEIDEERFEVVLPDLRFILEGGGDRTHAVITDSNENKEFICILGEPKKKTVVLIYKMVRYTVCI